MIESNEMSYDPLCDVLLALPDVFSDYRAQKLRCHAQYDDQQRVLPPQPHS